MKLRILAALTWMFTCSSLAMAQEVDEYFNSVRNLGMGGAGVAIANDETALLVNPAGLGRLRDFYVTIVDPEVDISENAEKIAGLQFMGQRNPQEALDKALANPDDHFHGRAQVFPSIVVPNFGFGLFGKYEIDSEYNSTDDVFAYNYTNDWAGVFGFNFRFWDGIIKIGANARITNRVEVKREDIPSNSTGLTLETLAQEGIGIGSDAGILIAIPVAWLPTIGAVYRDVGRTNFGLREGMFLNTTERPDSVPESLDVGLSLFPIMGNRVRSTFTVEYRDVLTTGDETDQMRRVHGGMEINVADALFIRGGMNQRYWTAGLELAIVNYQFQAAAYGEEIGTPDTPREDRRYVVKFAFRF